MNTKRKVCKRKTYTLCYDITKKRKTHKKEKNKKNKLLCPPLSGGSGIGGGICSSIATYERSEHTTHTPRKISPFAYLANSAPFHTPRKNESKPNIL